MTSKLKASPPTILTLTLPTPIDGGLPPEDRTATLLIQHGDLAHFRQFQYTLLDDLLLAIREASDALAQIEDHPPVIPETPPAPAKPQPKAKPAAPSQSQEPTITVPLKQGSMEVKISHLKIIGGETDAAAYRQAVLIASKLIDGKLWDGETPIRIDDVYAIQKRLKHLSEREMSLFTLVDFVQVGDGSTVKDN